MRAYCKSKSDEQRAACGCRKQEKEAKAQGVGGKPRNVSNICKEKEKQWVDFMRRRMGLDNEKRQKGTMPARNKKISDPLKKELE